MLEGVELTLLGMHWMLVLLCNANIPGPIGHQWEMVALGRGNGGVPSRG